MKLISSLTLITLSTITLFANDTTTLQDVTQKGETSTKLLLQTLGNNMKMHMKHGGAMEALDFCTQEAQNLTGDVNKKLPEGVSVRRITLKTRNPMNMPTDDEAKVLEDLQKKQNSDKALPKHIIKQVGKDTYKFYKPLVITNPVCLKCHGDIQDDKLKTEISNRYPEDKAIHYKMGDLRGAIVTTVKK
ncbi:Tll0287-like domain-containing protein [Sulfurimonas microaerophilic]|uniref:Tll0287-like domain-containing protein n=1 Tax=Sulfurimonas microaerophilic TaxID=3058392 RepID=UPI002714DDB3|nr:DUF3365 domain-containing protein [Sulfurimonas sp. hsl 1-7]